MLLGILTPRTVLACCLGDRSPLCFGWRVECSGVGGRKLICVLSEVGSTSFFLELRSGLSLLRSKTGASGPALLWSQVCRETSVRESGKNAGNLGFPDPSPAPHRGPPGSLTFAPGAAPSRCPRQPRGRGLLALPPRQPRPVREAGRCRAPRPLTALEDRRTLVAVETRRGRPPPSGPRAHAPTTTATSRRERGRSERARRARAGSATEPGAACASASAAGGR